jgi:hypothetical protein
VATLARIEVLIAFLVIGYIAGLPVLIRTLDDGRTISRRVWATLGRHRSRWERSLFLSYALGGWPVLPFAYVWRHSRLRHELRRERAVERDRGNV